MKLNVNKRTRNLIVGGLLTIVMAILVALFLANFKTLDVKAYAQDAKSNNADSDSVVTIQYKDNDDIKTYNYDSFGDAWWDANNLYEFLHRDITFTLNKDVELYNSQIENPNSGFFNRYIEEYNNKCFGCKGNGEQYQGKGDNDHFLLAMPGEAALTLDLNGHKLTKADSCGLYIVTPTLQIDHRNVNLVSNNEIKSEEDYGKIEAVSIFNDNQDISKALSIKNVKFDAKIQNPYVEVCSGVRCKTQYGLEIDNCIFTNYCFSSPIEVGSAVEVCTYFLYTNKTIFKNTKFISNVAEDGWRKKTHGGAIHADGFVANFNIDNCIFNSNSALEDGGAIMIILDPYCPDGFDRAGEYIQTNVINCTFESNQAGKNGGAIWNNNNSFCCANNKFLNNSAANRGGAIYAGSNKNSRSVECCLSFDTFSNYRNLKWREKIRNNETYFEGNHACNGGAIECHNWTQPLFAGRIIIKNNTALNRGGAINYDNIESETGISKGKGHIYLEENTYLYARFNYLPNREEDIRLESEGDTRYTGIWLRGQIDPNSEFGIWTHQRDHKVIEWYKEDTSLSGDWVGSHVPCNNDCGGNAWFETKDNYVKYWRDRD